MKSHNGQQHFNVHQKNANSLRSHRRCPQEKRHTVMVHQTNQWILKQHPNSFTLTLSISFAGFWDHFPPGTRNFPSVKAWIPGAWLYRPSRIWIWTPSTRGKIARSGCVPHIFWNPLKNWQWKVIKQLPFHQLRRNDPVGFETVLECL